VKTTVHRDSDCVRLEGVKGWTLQNHHATLLLVAALGSIALGSCSTPMKSATPSKHPMRATDLTPASGSTEPKIVRREKFLVMGTLTRIAPGTETGEKFASIWSEFEAHRGRIQPHSTDQKYYGISFASPDEAGFEYLAGMATSKVQAIHTGLVIREVPAATYAVFACPAPAIGPTKRYIFGEWRSQSGCQVDNSAPAFEQYPPAEDTESPVLIHIPIREAQVK